MPPSSISLARLLWTIVPCLVLGLAAVYLLLPRPRPYPRWWGGAAGGVALLLAGWLLVRPSGAWVESVLFYAFSAIAIGSGALLVTQSNPARAALSFALVVLSTCGLFLLQAAPFLMAATTIIYAGAIIVTFLFVLMLAQQEGRSDADWRSREPLLSCIAGFALLGMLLYVLALSYDTRAVDPFLGRVQRAAGADTAEQIGDILPDARSLDLLLDRVSKARQEETADGMAKALGDTPFFDDFERELRRDRGEPALPGWSTLPALAEQVAEARTDWIEARKAAAAESPPRLKEVLARVFEIGGRARNLISFFEAFPRLLSENRGSADLRDADLDELQSIQEQWRQARGLPGSKAVEAEKRELARLEQLVGSVRARLGDLQPDPRGTPSYFSGPPPGTPIPHDAQGNAPLPAENTAYLGRSLFTDYLLAVEAGGTLLLVATIGAIAIASRREERP